MIRRTENHDSHFTCINELSTQTTNTNMDGDYIINAFQCLLPIKVAGLPNHLRLGKSGKYDPFLVLDLVMNPLSHRHITAKSEFPRMSGFCHFYCNDCTALSDTLNIIYQKPTKNCHYCLNLVIDCTAFPRLIAYEHLTRFDDSFLL
jgi:hypothetical protein